MKNPVTADTKPIQSGANRKGEECSHTSYLAVNRKPNQRLKTCSHAGTGFLNRRVLWPKKTAMLYLCRCKYSNNLPFAMALTNSFQGWTGWARSKPRGSYPAAAPDLFLLRAQPKKSHGWAIHSTSGAWRHSRSGIMGPMRPPQMVYQDIYAALGMIFRSWLLKWRPNLCWTCASVSTWAFDY